VDARRNAYEAVGRIHFQGAFYRHDIADKALRTQAPASS
jgi:phosphoribosylamine-glycine ligase